MFRREIPNQGFDRRQNVRDSHSQHGLPEQERVVSDIRLDAGDRVGVGTPPRRKLGSPASDSARVDHGDGVSLALQGSQKYLVFSPVRGIVAIDENDEFAFCVTLVNDAHKWVGGFQVNPKDFSQRFLGRFGPLAEFLKRQRQ